jgi:hypothetical protein
MMQYIINQKNKQLGIEVRDRNEEFSFCGGVTRELDF